MRRKTRHPHTSGAQANVPAQAKMPFASIEPLKGPSSALREKRAGKRVAAEGNSPAEGKAHAGGHFGMAAQWAAKPKEHFGGKTHYPELISEEELAREQKRFLHIRAAHTPISLPETKVAQATKKRPTRLELAWQWLSSAITAIISHLSSLKGRKLLTLRGENALSQLQTLRDLYFATSVFDGMDEVAFRTAFGEAYYHILSESKRRHKTGAKAPDENYGHFLEQFARAASSLP